MRFNPRRTARKSNPWSLERARRDRTLRLVGDEAENVHVLDVRNGHRMMTTEGEIYSATYNSFSPLGNATRSQVVHELLAEGTVLANLKGLFYTAAYWTKRRQMRRAA